MSADKMRHPVTGALYERLDESSVRVVDVDGTEGVFDGEGRWLSGELRFADPHLCDFVGGRRPGRPR